MEGNQQLNALTLTNVSLEVPYDTSSTHRPAYPSILVQLYHRRLPHELYGRLLERGEEHIRNTVKSKHRTYAPFCRYRRSLHKLSTTSRPVEHRWLVKGPSARNVLDIGDICPRRSDTILRPLPIHSSQHTPRPTFQRRIIVYSAV